MSQSAWLSEASARRLAAGLRREVVARSAEDQLLDLAGNDYLGLARHPDVIAAGIEALTCWGAGATASRLVSGTTTLHEELERDLASFSGTESALVFSAGYTANLAAITALSGPGGLIVSDAWNHASLVDACRLSGARIVVAPHGDLPAMASALRGRPEERALLVTESVFSADGDAVDVAAVAALAADNDALLILDDAHGLGVAGPGGRGGLAAAGVSWHAGIVVTVTLSKALGSMGGAVLGSAAVRDALEQSGRSFIFDTALAPVSVATARQALRLLRYEPGLITDMRATARELASLARAAGFAVPEPAGAVVPIVLGSPERAVAAAATFLRHGIRVGCFRPPSVPAGTSRLRLTARPHLDDADREQICQALQAIK